MTSIQTLSDSDRRAVAHMGAHALGAAAYATATVSLANLDRPEAVQDEIRWQLARLDERERSVLQLFPPSHGRYD